HTLEHLTLVCFSSSRRHTRSKRDWSSDVCSSDLTMNVFAIRTEAKLDYTMKRMPKLYALSKRPYNNITSIVISQNKTLTYMRRRGSLPSNSKKKRKLTNNLVLTEN